ARRAQERRALHARGRDHRGRARSRDREPAMAHARPRRAVGDEGVRRARGGAGRGGGERALALAAVEAEQGVSSSVMIFIAVAWSGHVKGRSYSFRLYDQNVTAITDVWAVSLQHRLQPGGEQMTPKPHKIAFMFATVHVVGALMAITTWAAVPKHASD